MSDETTLSDLLALNLHNFEDEVHNIVDKATKELSMEKTLKELDVTWSQMEFQHDKHLRTGTMLLKSDEELIETLEDNQVRIYASILMCYYWCVLMLGSTSKHDDIKVYWFLFGRSFRLAEEAYHC